MRSRITRLHVVLHSPAGFPSHNVQFLFYKLLNFSTFLLLMFLVWISLNFRTNHCPLSHCISSGSLSWFGSLEYSLCQHLGTGLTFAGLDPREKVKEQQCEPQAASWAGLLWGDVFAGSEPRVALRLHAPEFPTGASHFYVKKLLSSALPFLSQLFHLSEAVSIRYSYACAFRGGGSAKPSTETLSFIPQFPQGEPKCLG